MLRTLTIMIVYFGLLLIGFSNAQNVLVTIPNGQLRGRQDVSTGQKPYFSFEGIPYAQPPLGSLRFQPPVPVRNWTGIRNATSRNIRCYHATLPIGTQSENCLFLNVYTPALPANRTNATYPVLVYIHAGAWIAGGVQDLGPQHFMDYDIVVVTLNYRLGPWGFLSTQDNVLPGNNGLKDQQLALNWTRANIAYFGGDPARVTLSGNSVGGASVCYHMLNPVSRNLFRAAIAQSGSCLNPYSFQRNPRKIAYEVAALINPNFANTSSSAALLNLYSNISADALRNATTRYNDRVDPGYYQTFSQGGYWAPVIEANRPGAFVTQNMHKQLSNGDISGNVSTVPLLIGIMSEELVYYTQTFTADYIRNIDNNSDLLVPDDMRITDRQAKLQMGQKIRQIYTNTTFSADILKLVRYYSDTVFNRGVIRNAELQQYISDVYFYQFSYHGAMGDKTTEVVGRDNVQHGEELYYLWAASVGNYSNFNVSQFSQQDQLTQRRLLSLFTNFVKFLNPTPQPSNLLQNITWPSVDLIGSDDLAYLNINATLEIRNNPKSDTYPKWVSLYDSLGYDDDFDTY